MIKAVIVDDEPYAAGAIETLVSSYSAEIKVCAVSYTINEAIEAIQKHRPDILFLDVELADGTGFELLDALQGVKAHVIFITAHEHYAIRAIKHNAFDYILKPINPAEIASVLQKVTNRVKQQAPVPDSNLLLQYLNTAISKKIAVPTQNGFQYYEIDAILYIEGSGSYTTLFMTGNKKLVVSRLIKDFEASLEEKGFLRVHRSYLINMNHIAELRRGDRGYLVMANGKEIPISPRDKEAILYKLHAHTNIV